MLLVGIEWIKGSILVRCLFKKTLTKFFNISWWTEFNEASLIMWFLSRKRNGSYLIWVMVSTYEQIKEEQSSFELDADLSQGFDS